MDKLEEIAAAMEKTAKEAGGLQIVHHRVAGSPGGRRVHHHHRCGRSPRLVTGGARSRRCGDCHRAATAARFCFPGMILALKRT